MEIFHGILRKIFGHRWIFLQKITDYKLENDTFVLDFGPIVKETVELDMKTGGELGGFFFAAAEALETSFSAMAHDF